MKTYPVSQTLSRTSSVGFAVRFILTPVLLALPLATEAADLVLNDLKAHGVQLSVDELRQLMPNAKVVSYSMKGSARRWKNEPSGKFVASSDVRYDPNRTGISGTGTGTWHVGDNATYCVTLEWKSHTENWCMFIFKVDGKYYGVRSIENGGAKAVEFEFSK
jgi:hypothetical protein